MDILKNMESLLEECDDKTLFRVSFEVIYWNCGLTQSEIESVIEKCVVNAWLYLARDIAERAGRKLNRGELNVIMIKCFESDDDMLRIAQEASDMRYELGFENS